MKKLTEMLPLDRGIRRVANHPNGDQLILDVETVTYSDEEIQGSSFRLDYPVEYFLSQAARDDEGEIVAYRVLGRGNHGYALLFLSWASAVLASEDLIAEFVARNDAEDPDITDIRLTGMY